MRLELDSMQRLEDVTARRGVTQVFVGADCVTATDCEGAVVPDDPERAHVIATQHLVCVADRLQRHVSLFQRHSTIKLVTSQAEVK